MVCPLAPALDYFYGRLPPAARFCSARETEEFLREVLRIENPPAAFVFKIFYDFSTRHAHDPSREVVEFRCHCIDCRLARFDRDPSFGPKAGLTRVERLRNALSAKLPVDASLARRILDDAQRSDPDPFTPRRL